MTRIVKSDSELSEDELNRLEDEEHLSLISVNHVLTHEYPPWDCMGGAGKQEVVRWVYHFKVGEEK